MTLDKPESVKAKLLLGQSEIDQFKIKQMGSPMIKNKLVKFKHTNVSKSIDSNFMFQ